MFTKIEKLLLKMAVAISKNKFINILKVSVLNLLPLWIIGAIFLLLAKFPLEYAHVLFEGFFGQYYAVWFYNIFTIIYILSTVILSISLSYNYALVKGVNPIEGACYNVISFCILFSNTLSDMFVKFMSGKVMIQEARGLSLQYIANEGIIVAILSSLFTISMLSLLYKKQVITNCVDTIAKNQNNIVKKIISIIFTSFIIFMPILLSYYGFYKLSINNTQSFMFGFIENIVVDQNNNLLTTTLYSLSNLISLFLGFTTSIINSSVNAFTTIMNYENTFAFQSGLSMQNIFTSSYINSFINIGGIGSTLSLVIIMFLFGKSDTFKKVSRYSIIPCLFGINAPILFTLPIILNPILLIPFLLVPVINLIISFGFTLINVLPITFGLDMIWTTPIGLSGLLATNNFNAVIIQVLLVFIGCCVYFPFARVLDKSYVRREAYDIINENPIKVPFTKMILAKLISRTNEVTNCIKEKTSNIKTKKIKENKEEE